MPSITPNLWFADRALEAAEFYIGIFPGSRITAVSHHTEATPGPTGTVLSVAFELAGRPFAAINGGAELPFTEAVSLAIECADQAEVDHYWERLSAGGAESVCGWLRDRYGLSWQVLPAVLPRLLTDPDGARVARVSAAMMAMTKLDVAALERAAAGTVV